MNNSPFHNPNSAPLPDANDVEKAFKDPRQLNINTYEPVELDASHRARLEADKQLMKKFIIRLLVIGFAIGGLLSIGLVWTMHQLDLVTPVPIERDR